MARKAESGFTLLEVVVAVAIAAIALIELFHIAGIGLFAADTASRIEEATERAQSRLAAFERTGALASGQMAGEDGDGYRWQLRATPVARQTSAEAGPALALYDLEAAIFWRERGRTRSVTLQTRRIGAAAAASE